METAETTVLLIVSHLCKIQGLSEGIFISHILVSHYLETNMYSIALLYYLLNDARVQRTTCVIYFMSVSLKEYNVIHL